MFLNMPRLVGVFPNSKGFGVADPHASTAALAGQLCSYFGSATHWPNKGWMLIRSSNTATSAW
jgi:hypothetical protein